MGTFHQDKEPLRKIHRQAKSIGNFFLQNANIHCQIIETTISMTHQHVTVLTVFRNSRSQIKDKTGFHQSAKSDLRAYNNISEMGLLVISESLQVLVVMSHVFSNVHIIM